jgi:hypothetical protein
MLSMGTNSKIVKYFIKLRNSLMSVSEVIHQFIPYFWNYMTMNKKLKQMKYSKYFLKKE